MIEDRLKELVLSPDEQKREEHFRQIERRLQKNRQRTKWQVGIISALVCMLAVFFIGTGEMEMPSPQSSAGEGITKAYIISGEGNPYSSLQNNVDKVDDADWLKFMAGELEGMKPVDIEPSWREVDFTIRLHYEQGGQTVYAVHMEGEKVYLKQEETGQLYELQNTAEVFFSKVMEALERNMALPYILALMALALVSAFLAERKWNKKDKDGRKPPRHSHSSQTLVTLLAVGLVIMLIVFVQNIHFFVPAGIIAAATAVNCFIESRQGKSTDRQLMMVMNSLQYLTSMVIIYLL